MSLNKRSFTTGLSIMLGVIALASTHAHEAVKLISVAK